MYSSIFLTSYGSGIVSATENGIIKVEIPDMSGHKASRQEAQSGVVPSDLTVQAAHLLQRYYTGERIDFSEIPVVLDGMTLFRQSVLMTIRNLGYGEICSYGQVAVECGSPFASRAIGGALASNPVPIIIPCHRVLASDGRLTGFSAPGGQATKMALLKMEGVEFKGMLVDKKQLVLHNGKKL